MFLFFIISFSASNGDGHSQTKSEKILKITPAKLVEKVRQQIQTNPKLSSAQVTAIANSMLEKYGYDYAFDVCESLPDPKSIDMDLAVKKYFRIRFLILMARNSE